MFVGEHGLSNQPKRTVSVDRKPQRIFIQCVGVLFCSQSALHACTCIKVVITIAKYRGADKEWGGGGEKEWRGKDMLERGRERMESDMQRERHIAKEMERCMLLVGPADGGQQQQDGQPRYCMLRPVRVCPLIKPASA